MDAEQLRLQQIHVLETAESNLKIVVDQVQSLAEDSDVSEIKRGLAHARHHIKKQIEDLKNGE